MNETVASGTGTVARVIEILRYIALHKSASIRSLSSDLGLAPSTSHQLLHLLVREGMIEHDASERRYGIGPAFVRMAALTTSMYRLRTIAMPFLTEVVEATGETTLLCLYAAAGGSMVFAEKIESRHMLRYSLPLYQNSSLLWGASGRSISAFLNEGEIRRLHEEGLVSPSTGEPLPPIDVLLKDLQQIRERGYAISHGEKIPGALGINAPFFSHGNIVGNIGITMPDIRGSEEMNRRNAELICDVARRLTKSLDAAS